MIKCTVLREANLTVAPGSIVIVSEEQFELAEEALENALEVELAEEALENALEVEPAEDVPKNALEVEPAEDVPKNALLSDMTKAQLVELANTRGEVVVSSMTKSQLISLLEK